MKLLLNLLMGYKTYALYGAIAVLALAGVYSFGHYKGVADQKLKTAQAETVALQKGVKGRGEIERKVVKLSDPDLDSQLDRWMRD